MRLPLPLQHLGHPALDGPVVVGAPDAGQGDQVGEVAGALPLVEAVDDVAVGPGAGEQHGAERAAEALAGVHRPPSPEKRKPWRKRRCSTRNISATGTTIQSTDIMNSDHCGL